MDDNRWVIGVWVVVVLFAGVTAFWSGHVGVPLRDPDGRIFRTRLTSALVLFAVLAVVDAIIRTGGGGWTMARMAAELRARWSTERLVLAASGLVAYHVVYICYRNLKSWVAFNEVHDDGLLEFERWLFLGHSPAVMLHDLLGHETAAYVLMVVYKSFTYLVSLSVVSALVFVDRIRDGYVFLTSALWVWILGVGSYYLIPTLGPFASAPQDFIRLPDTAITATQGQYLAEREHLLRHPGAGDGFASISAFASLHVGFTCMILIMLRYALATVPGASSRSWASCRARWCRSRSAQDVDRAFAEWSRHPVQLGEAEEERRRESGSSDASVGGFEDC